MENSDFPPTKILPRLSRTGELLSDKTTGGRERPWRMNKQISELLVEVTMYLKEEKRAERMRYCASWLLFLECIENASHPKQLKSAQFCRDRLCPACQWRRSLKEFAVALKVAHSALEQIPTLRFLFLTLTVPNVELCELGNEITRLTKSWNRLRMRAEVRRAVKGYHRAIEISYNSKENTFHPHIHVALAVPSRYFKSDMYIKRDRWLELWQQSTGLPEITQVDIRTIKGKKGADPLVSGFAEACKYSLKQWNMPKNKALQKIKKGEARVEFGTPGHIWIRNTLEESADVVSQLRAALHHRRLVQFGGVFKDIKKELNLKSAEESDDLVHVTDTKKGCQCEVCSSSLVEHLYHWKKLVGEYVG